MENMIGYIPPPHPVGAINRAPTAGRRFARLQVDAKIVRISDNACKTETAQSCNLLKI